MLPSHRLKRWLYFLAGMLAMILLLGLVYQLPPVQNRLAWRVDIIMTGLRTLIHPVGEMPTPVLAVEAPADSSTATITAAPTTAPTSTSTSFPDPALSATPPAPSTPTPAPTLSPTPLPGQVLLSAPKWEFQDWNNCGPATLTMYLRFYGWVGTQFDISKIVKPLRADRNVNVDELVQFVRTSGSGLNANFRVGGTIDVLRQFLAAGIPVMIEETFFLDQAYWTADDRWSGHYLLVNGYNDALRAFNAQDSFVGANRIIGYNDLNKNWQSFNRAFILVYHPEQEDIVKSILGDNWDVDVNRQHALAVATAETIKTPTDAFAWFNLGSNLVYFERYTEAAKAYDQARVIGIPQRMLRYQFGPFLAYFHSGRITDLMALTDYALKVTPNSEETLVWRGWALYRSGDREGALKQFNLALEAHPNYGDAVYGLNFVQNN
jgi:tetratricopeptide (TPR) repeat protein